MEPTDLKSIPPDDARLEAWYRANVSSASLPDDGFSQRVLAALPAPAPRPAIRRLFCVAGALLGVGVALVGGLSSRNLQANLPALDAALTEALAQLATPAVGCALGITAISLWFAFRDRLRLLPRL